MRRCIGLVQCIAFMDALVANHALAWVSWQCIRQRHWWPIASACKAVHSWECIKDALLGALALKFVAVGLVPWLCGIAVFS